MRLSPIAKLTDEQQALLEQIVGDRPEVPPPFLMWVHNMRLAPWAEGLGAHCRETSVLPRRLRILSMLIPGRHFDCVPMWNAHLEEGIGLGLAEESLQRLARREDPRFPAEDEQLFYEFATQTLEKHRVDDVTYDAALAMFGEEGLLDIVGSLGSFTMSCFALNAFELEIRPDLGNPFPDLAVERLPVAESV